jgi:hypothetical protein
MTYVYVRRMTMNGDFIGHQSHRRIIDQVSIERSIVYIVVNPTLQQKDTDHCGFCGKKGRKNGENQKTLRERSNGLNANRNQRLPSFLYNVQMSNLPYFSQQRQPGKRLLLQTGIRHLLIAIGPKRLLACASLYIFTRELARK